MPMSMNYAQMVEGCRHRNANAQRALYEELAPMAMGVCYRYTADRDEAQDLLQDGFIKIFERIGTLRDPQKLRSWTYNIMVNTCIQYYRRSRHTILQPMDDIVDDDGSEMPYTMDDIVKAMSTISPAQRMAFNLCCIEELPMDEVANRMNCNELAVRVALCKARKRMRQYLENKKEE